MSSLYGVTSLQTYIYFEKYWLTDPVGVKYTVVLLWLLETAHSALSCALIFRLLVLNFARNLCSSDDVTQGVLAATISVLYSFYIWRLWIFTRNYFLAGIATIFAACHFAFEMVVMAIIFKYPDFKDFTHATPWFTAAMAMAIAADTIISVSMTVILKARRTEVKGVFDIVILTASLAMPQNFVYLLFLNFINNLYSNSMLAMLNTRQSLRSLNPDTVMETFPTNNRSQRGEASTILVFRGEDTQNMELTKTSDNRV
ncbi:hypothetical protein K438DRAFT_1986377 [Mycena galopus ATCC 62051]|nr:hypothetical protein K438DRAFT_1986344 [Mycena galopus ATCC 62051]KAF8157760.1 hypothetical protein K438DRAFT_1986377 [Mycena galopus ATCC 62051]